MAEPQEADVDSIIDRLLDVRGSRPGKQVQLQEYEIRYLCTKAREIFIQQPILLELEAPIKVSKKGTMNFMDITFPLIINLLCHLFSILFELSKVFVAFEASASFLIFFLLFLLSTNLLPAYASFYLIFLYVFFFASRTGQAGHSFYWLFF